MGESDPTLHGFSIIAGEVRKRDQLIAADAFRGLNPASGKPLDPAFHPATDEDVDHACAQAWTAFATLGVTPPADLARFLDRVADNIRGLGALLIATAGAETGLSQARLESERDRAVFTLRVFADVARHAEWADPAIDTADPSRPLRARPDVRRCLRPLGPVAVFGASNFPLAYSTAGGDTASALAAGCPVIVKGHPAHPATGEMVAQGVQRAVEEEGMPSGTFSYLASGGRREHAIGARLVKHPCVRAVGFTGSPEGGTALAQLAAQRPDPIPVFAEMGSTNPVVLLEGALSASAESIADDLAGAVLGSSGQMCTCPGLIFMRRSSASESFATRLAERISKLEKTLMLSERVRTGYQRRVEQIASVRSVDVRVGDPAPKAKGPQIAGAEEPLAVTPALFSTDAGTFKDNVSLHDEAFGPCTILVYASSAAALLEALASVQGALAGAIYRADGDEPLASHARTVLEQRVGRLVFNAVTTGVEVTHAMVHGGPFPASNQPHTTAVGSAAIRRWCRPVCYQNATDPDVPAVIQDANPLGVLRLVNGRPSREPVTRS